MNATQRTIYCDWFCTCPACTTRPNYPEGVTECQDCDGLGFGYEGKGAAVGCETCTGGGLVKDGRPWWPNAKKEV